MDAKRIYELMVLTAWADGNVEASEALAVHEIVTANFKELTGKAALSKGVKALIDEKGLEAALREKAAGLTTPDEREAAFRYCAQVLHADGDLGAEEAGVLASLQEIFGFSTEDVKRLMAP